MRERDNHDYYGEKNNTKEANCLPMKRKLFIHFAKFNLAKKTHHQPVYNLSKLK